jgi:hypothetical protein
MPAILNNPFSVAFLGLTSLDDTSKAKKFTPITAEEGLQGGKI